MYDMTANTFKQCKASDLANMLNFTSSPTSNTR